MGITRWPVYGRAHSYELRVDEQSTKEEIEAEVEYWMTQLQVYNIEGVDRAALLQAIRWMNDLHGA